MVFGIRLEMGHLAVKRDMEECKGMGKRGGSVRELEIPPSVSSDTLLLGVLNYAGDIDRAVYDGRPTQPGTPKKCKRPSPSKLQSLTS